MTGWFKTLPFWDAPLERATPLPPPARLVVLDGVRWQEVFGGADRALAYDRGMNPLAWASPRKLMPNLQRLLDTRAIALGAPGRGAPITATGPQFISMPGYLEIFAGHPAPACASNDCARPAASTVVDDVLESSGADDVAVVSSWPSIARAASADPSRLVLSAGRKRVERGDVLRADEDTAAQLDRGLRAKSFPGEGDYRPDAITARVALGVPNGTAFQCDWMVQNPSLLGRAA